MATASDYSDAPNIVTTDTPAKHLNHISISKVRVVVRVRPFLQHDVSVQNRHPISCISVSSQDCESGEEVTVYLKDPDSSRKECYKLDSFFDQEENNLSRIFYREVSPLIPGIFDGCNATVFAYGATGSGKTFTMQGTDDQPGLMSLAVSTILSLSQKCGSTVQISYYEVYMDRCYDLLEVKENEIAVLDDKDGQTHLKGLSSVPIKSMSDFREVFSSGVQRRKVAHTGLNDVSSRSHGVLVVSVSTPFGDGNGTVVSGKLNLIDLAGNEDNRRTCNEGIRLQESAKINQSLFALSNVIYALNNKHRVPYRESKLTRILQDSLGGSSRALMVACLNPGEYQESVHTVSLAARSRHVSNFIVSTQKVETPKVKVDMEAKLRAWLESKGKTKSSQKIGTFTSPWRKTPSSLSTAKRSAVHENSFKGQNSTNQFAVNRALDVAFSNLQNDKGPLDFPVERFIRGSNDNKDSKHDADLNVEEVKQCLADNAPLYEESIFQISKRATRELLPTCQHDNAMKSPLRKVLSPINPNSNGKTTEEGAFANPLCASAECKMKTPKATVVSTCENNMNEITGTPLDKFSSIGSSLKNCLVEEYIIFLNNANRDELLEMKGIGEKTADYIMDLRETSPLKNLSDLEKIGLSTKQVHKLFNLAARTLFDHKYKDITS